MTGIPDAAIVEAAQRFRQGLVDGQKLDYAPSPARFCTEARRVAEALNLRDRPRLPAPPAYRKGPLAPFEIKRQKALTEYTDRPVLFEDITYDQWRRLSAEKAVPVGAVWVASLGAVYGPKAAKQAKAA